MIKYLLIILTICGCYGQKTAVRQYSRAVAFDQKIGLDWCALTVPVKTITDSTGYKKSMERIDSLRKVYLKDSIGNAEILQDFQQEMDNLLSKVPDTIRELCDSVERPYKKALQERDRIIQKLEKENSELSKSASNIKPVIDTVENTAALKSCELERKRETARANSEQLLKEKFRGQRNKLRWILAGTGAIGLIWLFFFIRRKVTK